MSITFYFLEINFILIVIGFILNIGIFKQIVKNIPKKIRISLLSIVILGILLTTLVAPRTHRIYYDENIYLNIGQNLACLKKAQMCNDGSNEYGVYKVLEAVVERGSDKKPLVTHFGGIPLQWNKWVAIGDTLTEPIWSSGRSEVIERLLAQQCELCGARDRIEVHHIHRLADLECKGRDEHKWMWVMSARHRKTLVVCQSCHNSIHYGRYDGTSLSKQVTGELRETEIAHA